MVSDFMDDYMHHRIISLGFPPTAQREKQLPSQRKGIKQQQTEANYKLQVSRLDHATIRPAAVTTPTTTRHGAMVLDNTSIARLYLFSQLEVRRVTLDRMGHDKNTAKASASDIVPPPCPGSIKLARTRTCNHQNEAESNREPMRFG